MNLIQIAIPILFIAAVMFFIGAVAPHHPTALPFWGILDFLASVSLILGLFAVSSFAAFIALLFIVTKQG